MAESLLLKLAYTGVLAALGAALTNRGIAVYHDGLRTLVPELAGGGRTRPELARFAWSISGGFILGYALPFGLLTGVLVLHAVMLSADVIGIRAASPALAAAAAFPVGVGLALCSTVCASFLATRVAGMERALQSLWLPAAVSIPFVPVLAAGRHFGWRPGLALLAAVGAVAAACWFGVVFGPGDWLGAAGLALLVGMLGLVAIALREPAGDAVDLAPFATNLDAIRRHLPWLALVGALQAVGASQGWLAGEPLQLALLQQDARADAFLVAICSSLAYLPLVTLTGMVSGAWNQDGYPDWIPAWGYLLPWPWLAAPAGAAAMAVEVLGVRRTVALLQRKPGLSGLGAALREALDEVAEWGLFGGSVLAGLQLAGAPGAAVAVGARVVNDMLGRPVMPVAVPALAVLGLALARALAG